VCGARKQGLWWKIVLIATGPHIVLELHEHRQEQVPQCATLKVNGVTLITEQKKRRVQSLKNSFGLMRTLSSLPWSPFSERAVLFCTMTGSTLILRFLPLQGRSEKLLKDWKAAGPLGFTVFRTLFSRIWPVGRSFIWLMCSILVLSYVIFLRHGSTPPWFQFPSLVLLQI
jgi:hypothetical protein